MTDVTPAEPQTDKIKGVFQHYDTWRLSSAALLDDAEKQLAALLEENARLREALNAVVQAIKDHRAGWATNPVGVGFMKVLNNVLAIENAVTRIRDAAVAQPDAEPPG